MSTKQSGYRAGALALLGLVVAGALSGAGRSRGAAPAGPAADAAKVRAAHASLPMSFEPNRGQTDGQVKFLARGRGYALFLTASEAVLALQKPGESRQSAIVRMKLAGANPAPRVVADQKLSGTVNYFYGSDPQEWRTRIPTFGKVRYQQVYPGIDLLYYGKQQQLEYDFVVAPGADPQRVRLAFDGVEQVEVDRAGELVLRTGGAEIRQQKPVVYQEAAGRRQPVAGRYVMLAKHEVGFEVASYDRSRSLVIDPVLTYSTYLGGSGAEEGKGIAIDGEGNMYVTGCTTSTNFPTQTPASTPGTGIDVFVSKITPLGDRLVYSSYIGSAGTDVARGIAVDLGGNAYLAGETSLPLATSKPTFPTTGNAFDPSWNGGKDAFLTRLSSGGNALEYSTLLGGPNDDVANAIDVTVDRNQPGLKQAVIAGKTTSPGLPAGPADSPAERLSLKGASDALVAKFDTWKSGNPSLIYLAYLGGAGDDCANGVALDSAGSASITGGTNSADFPSDVVGQAYSGGIDAFVTRFDPTTSHQVFSTLLGGSADDEGFGVDVLEKPDDGESYTFVTGATASTNYPVFQPAQRDQPGLDAFVTKLNRSGERFYSTYVGGSGNDYGTSIAVDILGSAFITGQTNSANFPVTTNRLQGYGGGTDAFLCRMNQLGNARLYCTYLGGSGNEYGSSVVVDSVHTAYLTGQTTSSTASPSTPFPRFNAFQPLLSGASDAFVTRITHILRPDGLSARPTILKNNNTTVALGTRLTWTDNSADEENFEIQRRILGDNLGYENPLQPKVKVGPNVTEYVDPDLSSETVQYVYRVRATHRNGNSGWSNEAMSVLPAPPTNLVATAVASSVTLVWKDNAYNETGFEIERKDGNDPGWTPITVNGATANQSLFPPVPSEGGTGTAIDVNLPQEETYTYRIRSVNAYGKSDWSDFPIVDILGQPVLQVAREISSTDAKVKVFLKWADNSSREQSYRIQRIADPDPRDLPDPNSGSWTTIQDVAENVTTFVDSTASAETNYFYRLAAITTSPASSRSDYSAVALNQRVWTVAAPTNLSVGFAGVFPLLTWKDNSRVEGDHNYGFDPIRTGMPGTAGFAIERRQVSAPAEARFRQLATVPSTAFIDGGGVWHNTAGNGSFVDTGAAFDAIYEYRVRALNNTGFDQNKVSDLPATNPPDLIPIELRSFSNYSNVVTRSTRPAPPVGLTATMLEGQYPTPTSIVAAARASLSWTNVSTTATGLRIERQPGGTVTTLGKVNGALPTTYIDPGPLDDITSYTWRVTAVNDAGDSTPSNAAGFKTLGDPTGLTATVLSGTEIKLNWVIRSTKQVRWEIQRTPGPLHAAGFGIVGVSEEPFVNEWTDTNVEPGRIYTYQVRAFNRYGEPTLFTVSAAINISSLAPPVFSSLTPLTSRSISIRWSDQSSGEAGFELQRATQKFVNNVEVPKEDLNYQPEAKTTANTQQHTDMRLPGGDPVPVAYYRIRAFDTKGGFTPWVYSAGVNPLPIPISLKATPGVEAGLLNQPTTPVVYVRWEYPTNSASGFQIRKSTPENTLAPEIIDVGNVRSYRDGNPRPDARYEIRAKGVGNDRSGWSAFVTATP